VIAVVLAAVFVVLAVFGYRHSKPRREPPPWHTRNPH